MKIKGWILLVVCLSATACTEQPRGRVGPPPASPDAASQPASFEEATPYGREDTLSREALERGRYDASWRATISAVTPVQVDTTTGTESWDDISVDTVNAGIQRLPLSGKVAGPSVLRVQVLLDRARFSPGVIDGRWGKNTEKAVYWLQHREGLPATGQVDATTFRRLEVLADRPERLVYAYSLSEEDVAGPFIDIPDDIYDKARLDRLGYESLAEKLSEHFHSTPELLQQLNPGRALDALKAGDTLMVPDLGVPDGTEATLVARLVVSGSGFYVHAEDSTGRLLYHFPSTLGSSYDPSPQGDFKVTSITEDPWWHYQPSLLAHVPDHEKDARIPPGPNNAVGRVWIALSEPHYGIHGTSAPETIGYVTSAGCVRLTNWDALFLGRHLERGTPVVFRDTRKEEQAQAGG